ncbi:MAG: hypothetical protein JRG81_00255 [Deltaproteobacteria bacterium]|nr:hypothetical protein [Deltaproteobacteria bacterium]MBW2363509.1 hypothetical protein [Deltaproteobacteria bacterium]
MITESEIMSLLNIGRGMVVQKFDDAVSEVITDIYDHNSSDKVRTITVQMKIAPTNDSRNIVGIEVGTDIKNPKSKPFVTAAMLETDEKGKVVARELQPQQTPLPLKPKVIDFDKQ